MAITNPHEWLSTEPLCGATITDSINGAVAIINRKYTRQHLLDMFGIEQSGDSRGSVTFDIDCGPVVPPDVPVASQGAVSKMRSV